MLTRSILLLANWQNSEHLQYSGFWYFARLRTRQIQVFPRNPAKFPKKREILRNPPEIFPNTCRQNIFNTYLGYLPGFIHPKRPNLAWNFVTATSKQCPKTTRRFYMNVAKNWALTILLIALTFAHFWSELLLKEQMVIPVKKNVHQRWSYQRKIDWF